MNREAQEVMQPAPVAQQERPCVHEPLAQAAGTCFASPRLTHLERVCVCACVCACARDGGEATTARDGGLML